MKNVFSKVSASKIITVGLISSAFLLPLSASAEIKAGSVEVTPFAGVSVFEHGQNLKLGPVYGGRLGYNFTKYFGLEAAVGFTNSSVDDKSIAGAKEGQYRAIDRYGRSVNKVDMISYHLDAVYHFLPDGKFTPFIVAGFGGTHYRPSISNNDMATINFGAGAKMWLTDNIALRVDLRDHVVSEVFQEAYHNLNATAGIVFAFGGTSSSPVKAVVPPECPACVIPECPACVAPVKITAKDTTAPYVTLATPYNASVDSHLQKKVQIAFSEPIDQSTMNEKTFTLYQGKTVVPGTVTANSDQTANFTPASEFTPDTQYTGKITTGVRDIAGNSMKNDYTWSFKTAPTPDPTVVTKVKTKVVVVDKFVMLTGAHFAFDSAELTPAGKDVIKPNIKIIKENSDLKVRIAGHTSAAGSEKYNQALSERRANNVRDFVIAEGGIAPERLEVIGYGETRPIMKEVNPNDHGSKAAKANMRVVFEVIAK